VYSTHTAHVTALPAQPEGIETLGFSPDGAQLVIGSIIGSLNTYRTSDGAQLESYAGDVGTVMAVSWSGTTRPTGLYTAGLDSQLASWSIGVGPRLLSQRGPDLEAPDRSELFGHVALGLTPQFSSPATERGYAVDVRSGRFETWPLHLGNNGSLNQAVASWDGRRALLSIEDGAGENRIVIWDLVANRQVGQLHLPDDAPRVFDKGMDAGISPNGALAYCNLTATRIGVFDLPSGRYLRSFSIHYAGRDGARVVADPWQFDPNGQLLVAGSDTGPHPHGGGIGPDDTAAPDQRLGLVDVRTGRLIAQTELGDVTAPSAVAWSPDHKLLAVGTYDGSLSLYDARTLRELASAGMVQAGYVRTLSFAPSGRDIVVGGTDDTLSFWSVPDLSREGTPVILPTGPISGPLFAWYTPSGEVVGLAPDERRTASDMERWFTFPAAPAQLAHTACALAGGDMTRSQWAKYVGDQPHRKVC
jgi:WD40 repeat protein